MGNSGGIVTMLKIGKIRSLREGEKYMEIWKTVVGFKNVADNYYEISSDGNVRYISDHYMLHKKISFKPKHPYYSVYLLCKDGLKRWILVHQLVATFFVQVPDKYKDGKIYDLVPDHLDNNGLNNHYTNLEWKTRSENIKSAFAKGFINNKCDNNGNSIITNEEAINICKLLEDNKSYSEIIELMGFPDNKSYRSLLVRIKNGVAWKEISDQFDIKREQRKFSNKQQQIVQYIPLIRKYIQEGKRNSEIIELIWGKDCKTYNSKDITIRNIRRGKIYNDIL